MALSVREALSQGSSCLSAVNWPHDSGTPFLDASILLSLCMQTTREKLFAMRDEFVSEDALHAYRSFIQRRARGEALAYITGTKEFYGRLFTVNGSVLVPRPDSELLVETAKDFIRSRFENAASIRVHDAFCGSGCIGISIAAECPQAAVSLSDISQKALSVARENAARLTPTVRIERRDILKPLGWNDEGSVFDMITANPPYVASTEAMTIPSEPRLALDGGIDGLALYPRIIDEARYMLRGALLMELGEGQADYVMMLLRQAGYGDVHAHIDLAGTERVVSGWWYA